MNLANIEGKTNNAAHRALFRCSHHSSPTFSLMPSEWLVNSGAYMH